MLELLNLQEQNLSQIQIQTLKLLTMSNSELEKYIEKQAEDNPLLKVKYNSNIYESENVSSYAQKKSDDYSQFYESLADKRKTLSETLEEQFHLLPLKKIERDIGDLIIHSLDKNGFLSLDRDLLLENISDPNKDKIYYKMCDTISTLEPVGCACSDVYESLKKQFWLSHSSMNDDEMLALDLINKTDFENYSKGNLNLLSKKLKATKAQIQKAFDIIKTLNPFPGLSYNINWDKYEQSDIVINDTEDGDIDIYVDSTQLPSVEIDEDISADFLNEKKNITSYKNEANNLISLLELRKESLGKVALFMIKRQQDYITGKTSTKSALSLKDISEATGLSVSTISRIINCHSAQYNGKSFELRTLLEQKTFKNNTQDDVMDKIKKIIESSDKKLSDEKISQKLDKEFGIKVARRTVQKYRMKLNISSSYSRG